MTAGDERGSVPQDTMRRCTRRRWCEGMALALHGVPQNGTGKGLSASRGWVGEPLGTDPPKLIGVTYHTKARDPGIILNLCPWCGERIRFDEEVSMQPAEHGGLQPAAQLQSELAKALRTRAASERLVQSRGALTRDGSSARAGYAADVLEEEALRLEGAEPSERGGTP